MKKTLIAIAALAATSAFAQSTVTMSGTVDVGYWNSSAQVGAVAAAAGVAAVAEVGIPGTVGYVAPVAGKAAVAAVAAGDTKASSFNQNGSSTSALNISGTEDLGGGMSASFFIESNWAMDGGASTFALGQRFVGLAGGFGAVKLGAANSAILTTALNGDSFGTAVGGNYSGRFSLTGNGTGTRVIRNANSLRYETPAMGGFGASYELAFANKDATSTNVTTAGANILGLTYAAGPLSIAFANGQTTSAGTVAADAKVSQNLLSGKFTAGAVTVSAGWTGYKTTAANVTTDQTSSINLGLKYQVSGTTSVQASMAKRSDKFNVVAANASLLALGADYAMSKRTTAYGRYETIDTNKASDTTGKSNILAVGIKHTF